MATVTGITAAKAAEILGQSVVSGAVNGLGRLILTRSNGTTIDGGDFLASVQAGQAQAISSAVATEVYNRISGTNFDRGDKSGVLNFNDVTNNTLANALFEVRLVGDASIAVGSLPMAPKVGTQFAYKFVQDSVGSRILTLTGFKKSQGVLNLTTTPDAIDIVVFMYDGTNWYAGFMGVDFK